jgi:apolipoprotein D and lipocalin family protein
MILGGAAFAVLALATVCGAPAQQPSALPSVDLNRFAGSWYEITRLPNKREKGCVADVMDLIALADKNGHLQLVTSCEAKNDYLNVANASIKAEKGSDGGRLKVTYVWPFSDKDWILAIGADYEWVLLGSPNHKVLRVLSRTRTLSPDLLSEIKQKAASEGYAANKMTMTVQTRL